MNKWLVAGASLAYLALLFGVAYWIEYQKKRGKTYTNKAWVYALSLAVYCTGWTYYGSVGRATTRGAEFTATYLGPTLMCALFVPVLLKMVRICKTQRISSIADFVSTRYGKNFSLGVIVMLCCVIGIIPYISLQLKAISTSFHIITGMQTTQQEHFWQDDSFYITILLAVFIIMFGTRSVDASERHEGLVGAIAFESMVKMVGFLTAGLFVTYGLFSGFGDLFAQAQDAQLEHLFVLRNNGFSTWLSVMLVSMTSMILLPRQFQVAVVENTDERHIRKAMWMFPLYLLLINVFVLPIALGGLLSLGNTVHPDTYVLSLPMAHQQGALSMLVYIGGLSAASGMMIVETIALSTMVSNHLVLPAVFRSSRFASYFQRSASHQIIRSRRASIVVILLIAYLYDTQIASYFSLVSIGQVSMAAVIQFAPTVVGALYWRQASRRGAIAGIVSGFLVWAYTLLVPSMVSAGFVGEGIMTEGLFGMSWLKPQALFGLTELELLPHSLFWSLLVNIGCFTVISLRDTLSPEEIFQANTFVDIFRQHEVQSVWRRTALLADLKILLGNFIGNERSEKLLVSYAHRYNLPMDNAEADSRMVSFSEKILSGVIGSASAKLMIGTITKEEKVNEDVLNIVRESQQVLELNKELKKKSIELTRATELLKQANEQLKMMDGLKDEFLYTVTHELRTPLTSIRALSEIIYDNPDMEEDMRQHYVNSISKETERLNHLITQVLNLERYESGRQKLHFSSVDISALIDEVLESLHPLSLEKQAQIQFSRPDSMYVIQCDRDLVRQVIYNLVSNALKYIPAEAGRISIVVLDENEEMKVWVEDNGKGIPTELHTLIFDKFFQAHNQTLKKPEGTGLGLAICKRIVEMHQGRIWAENKETPGVRFVFTLPYNL